MADEALSLVWFHFHAELRMQLFIEAGAAVDTRNDNGLTPLFCAIDRGRSRSADLLMTGGADLTTRGYRNRTLLHMTARAGMAGPARKLLAAGADVNARDARGATPLELAFIGQHAEMVTLLTAHGGEGDLDRAQRERDRWRKPKQDG